MKTVTVGEIAEINPKADPLANDTPVSFVGMAEMDAQAAAARPREDRPFGEVSKGYTSFRNGDLLAAKITGCWENTKVGVAELDHPNGAGSTEFHVIRPRPEADVRYLMHFMRQPRVIALGTARMSGSVGQKRVPRSFIEGLHVPLPPLPEQRRIAAILDHANALRAKRRQVLTHLDALSQSIFREMFGDPVANPRGISTAAIGVLANVVTGNSPSRADADNFGDSIEWIKSDNLGGDVATLADEWLSEQGRRKARIAPAGSILVTCIAGSPTSIGKASLVDRDVAFNQQINAILPSPRVNAAFLLAQLKTAPGLVRAKSTGGMKGLVNKSAFQSIDVLSPPVEAQQAFASKVAAVANQADAAQHALTADDELFAALQSRAFRGL